MEGKWSFTLNKMAFDKKIEQQTVTKQNAISIDYTIKFEKG